MTVTGVANPAVKVANLDAAVEFYRRAGAQVTDPEAWRNGLRADVALGPSFTGAVPRLGGDERVRSVFAGVRPSTG